MGKDGDAGVSLMSVEEVLRSKGLVLPAVAKPLASYVPAVRTGNLVFTSGQIPSESGELKFRGQVGLDLSQEDGVKAARMACLNALAAVASVAGDLDQVRQIVRVNGYVNSADGFTDQPTVVNGASDLLVELFGERGQHTRCAVGVSELPRNAAVEIDLVVEIAT
jgi:enamine deaminase RidA (YjgF/YER057c/UK114 family)